jgi:hypothetical protein
MGIQGLCAGRSVDRGTPEKRIVLKSAALFKRTFCRMALP